MDNQRIPLDPDQRQDGPQPTIPQIDEEMQHELEIQPKPYKVYYIMAAIGFAVALIVALIAFVPLILK